MKRSRMLYVIVGAVGIALVVGAATQRVALRVRSTAESAEETRSAIVERGTMSVAVSASGSVEPQSRVRLAFEVPGRVAEVPVEVGEPVAAGDVLARLDDSQLALSVEQAEAALASAEAQLAQGLAGPRPEDIAAAEANLRVSLAQVSGAMANLDQLEAGPTDAQIAAAEAELASAALQQKAAQIAYDGTDKRDTRKKEQARYNLHAANEALAAAQAGLDELLAGLNADQVRAARANVWAAVAQGDAAQARLDLVRAGATPGEIAGLEARLTQAQVALELSLLSLENTTLRAPFAGTVAEINVTAGEMASPGLPAITLIDASRFRLEVSVDEMDVGWLAEGQGTEVTLDALPDTVISGTVERIAPAATILGGVVDYAVTIGLSPTAPAGLLSGGTDALFGLIRADMTGNATIAVQELTDVLMIPTWVVRVDRSTGQTYVSRRVGPQIERVDVTLGVRYEGVVQVLSGLSEGDEVILVPESTSFDITGADAEIGD